MPLPHLTLNAEEGAPAEAAALFERAHQKFGPAPLPRALVRMGHSPALFRDAMLNLEKVVGEKGVLTRTERLLVALGVAANFGAEDLAHWFDGLAADAGVPAQERRAAIEVATACRVYNHYFKSRTLLDAGPLHDFQVQLRSSPFVQPGMDKRLAETLCVAVSVANGCKSCTTGHVATASQAGATPAQIDDAIRLQAVIAGLAPLDG